MRMCTGNEAAAVVFNTTTEQCVHLLVITGEDRGGARAGGCMCQLGKCSGCVG